MAEGEGGGEHVGVVDLGRACELRLQHCKWGGAAPDVEQTTQILEPFASLLAPLLRGRSGATQVQDSHPLGPQGPPNE